MQSSSMNIATVTAHLESVSPLHFQESYDNAGLITGDGSAECTGIITCLDATEAIIDEAISTKCNLVVAHHPVIFGGLKKITGRNYVERTVVKAIRNNIAIYAIHTNLDNVIRGVNGRIAAQIGLKNIRILQPREQLLKKLITFAPAAHAEAIRQALFNAGGGKLGKYSECSFNTEGTGTFKPLEGADPYVGEIGKRHEENEMRIEVIFPGHIQQRIIEAMIEAHPYEEVAYDIIALGNFLSDVGSGLVGEIHPVEETAFLGQVKSAFNLAIIRHTRLTGRKIRKVALCGGAGHFLLPAALSSGADVYITSDIKYHEFFDAEGMLLLDIGHYESEQFTIDLLYDILTEKFPNFAVRKTAVNTNPVHYYL